MEKDYFKDRLYSDICYKKNINIGDHVFICTKDMQSSAVTLKDLKLIKVDKTLTYSDYHPRGIKVSGESIDYKDTSDKLYTGRITYKCNSPFSIKTYNGTKAIVRKNGFLYLEDIDSLKGLKRPALWFAVLDISISTLLDPFTYVDGSSIDTEINKASFSRTHLSYEIDGLKNITTKNIDVYKNGEKTKLGNVFLEARDKLSGQVGVNGYSVSLPISFVGVSLEDVSMEDFPDE